MIISIWFSRQICLPLIFAKLVMGFPQCFFIIVPSLNEYSSIHFAIHTIDNILGSTFPFKDLQIIQLFLGILAYQRPWWCHYVLQIRPSVDKREFCELQLPVLSWLWTAHLDAVFLVSNFLFHCLKYLFPFVFVWTWLLAFIYPVLVAIVC